MYSLFECKDIIILRYWGGPLYKRFVWLYKRSTFLFKLTKRVGKGSLCCAIDGNWASPPPQSCFWIVMLIAWWRKMRQWSETHHISFYFSTKLHLMWRSTWGYLRSIAAYVASDVGTPTFHRSLCGVRRESNSLSLLLNNSLINQQLVIILNNK